MNARLLRQRRRTLQALAGAALALVLANLVQQPGNSGNQGTDRLGEPVFPRIERELSDVRLIRVTLADLSYTMRRDPAVEGRWTMIESGEYPVRVDRLAELAAGIAGLEWGERRTGDPEKLDRIGLGDPEAGGTGAQIDLSGAGDGPLASLVTGRKGERLYGRLPDETQAYVLTGDLPPLYTRQSWLDMDIIDMQEDAIAAVRLTGADGRSIYLTRPAGSGSRAFRPAPPYEAYTVISSAAASGPGLALSRFDPIDVKPATAIETRRAGRHVTTTHDGLEVDVSAYREPDGLYVTLRAVEAGEGAARAETINQRAEGWAFRLAEIDWNEFVPAIGTIVRPPLVPDPVPAR